MLIPGFPIHQIFTAARCRGNIKAIAGIMYATHACCQRPLLTLRALYASARQPL